MYKIPDKVVQFIKKTMETWREELTGGKILAEVKIQRGKFQGQKLLPLLLFVIAMMSLNHILRNCTAEHKLSKLQKKINMLMYIDNIKLFAKSERELEPLIQTVRICSKDI